MAQKAKRRKAKREASDYQYPKIDERAAPNFVSLQEIVMAARRYWSPW